MLLEKNNEHDLKFVVNPTGVITDLFAKRFVVEGVVKNNPERKKELMQNGIIGTSLDSEIVSSIRRNRGIITKYPLISSGNNIFDTFSSLSFKPSEDELKESVRSKITYQYDCPPDSIDEIMKLMPSCQSVLKTESGEKVIRRTVEYRNRIANLWKKCGSTIDSYIKSVVGEANLEGNGRKVVVSVMAPMYKNQKNFGEDKDTTIFYYSQFENENSENKKHHDAYTVAALTHAKVHETMLPYKLYMTKEKKDRFHAFIKFLTDKEVYHMLTGKSYLDIDTVSEKGKVMAEVYPYWLGYLHRRDANPAEAIEKDIKRDMEAYKTLQNNPKKKKLYGDYNFEKLSARKIARFFIGKKAMTPYEFADIDFNNRENVEVTEKKTMEVER